MSDRPDDVDAAFAEIVAGLEREGVGRLPELDDGPVVPDDPADPTEPFRAQPPDPVGTTPPTTSAPPRKQEPPRTWRGHDADWDWSWGTEEEHYVPPEPPPLPRPRPLTIVALVLVVVGVVLLIIPTLIGLDARVATPIALLSITCGGGMLLLRVRQTPRDPQDPGARDDGAQI